MFTLCVVSAIGCWMYIIPTAPQKCVSSYSVCKRYVLYVANSTVGMFLHDSGDLFGTFSSQSKEEKKNKTNSSFSLSYRGFCLRRPSINVFFF